MSSWPTSWFPITWPVNPATDIRGTGVYRIRATTAPGVAKRICRACKDDDEGIAYIGSSKSLVDRIGELFDRQGHAGTHSFLGNFKFYGLDRLCPRESLEIQWYECDDPEAEEERLLDEYKKRFGDLPPGNLKLGCRGESP